MKKLVFMFVAVAAISFASCGNNKAEQAPVEDTVDTVAVDTVPTDSAATATTAAEESQQRTVRQVP